MNECIVSLSLCVCMCFQPSRRRQATKAPTRISPLGTADNNITSSSGKANKAIPTEAKKIAKAKPSKAAGEGGSGEGQSKKRARSGDGRERGGGGGKRASASKSNQAMRQQTEVGYTIRVMSSGVSVVVW